MTLPSQLTPAPSPRVAPRLRYVVDLPAGDGAHAIVEAFRLHARAAAALMSPGITQRALLLLAGGRVEEVPR